MTSLYFLFDRIICINCHYKKIPQQTAHLLAGSEIAAVGKCLLRPPQATLYTLKIFFVNYMTNSEYR